MRGCAKNLATGNGGIRSPGSFSSTKLHCSKMYLLYYHQWAEDFQFRFFIFSSHLLLPISHRSVNRIWWCYFIYYNRFWPLHSALCCVKIVCPLGRECWVCSCPCRYLCLWTRQGREGDSKLANYGSRGSGFLAELIMENGEFHLQVSDWIWSSLSLSALFGDLVDRSWGSGTSPKRFFYSPNAFPPSF